MTEQTAENTHAKGNRIPDPASVEQERLCRLYARIDEKLAAERQAELDDLFHVNDTFASENPEIVAELKARFLEQKQGLDLRECFELSLQEPYFGQVYVVKLASTDHSEPDASQELFRDTNYFLHWLKTQGPLAGLQTDRSNGSYVSETMGDDVVREALSQEEDPGDKVDRLKSGRWMDYELFDDEDGTLEHRVVIIRRIRPFADATVEIDGKMCSMKLYKETTFTVRLAAFNWLESYGGHAVANQHHVILPDVPYDGTPMTHFTMRTLETWLYTPAGDDPIVQRHRHHTAIYSAVVPLEVDGHVESRYDS